MFSLYILELNPNKGSALFPHPFCMLDPVSSALHIVHRSWLCVSGIAIFCHSVGARGLLCLEMNVQCFYVYGYNRRKLNFDPSPYGWVVVVPYDVRVATVADRKLMGVS